MSTITIPMLRSALFFSIAIILTESLNLGMAVFSVFLGPALILHDTFSFKRSMSFVMLIGAYFLLGTVLASVFIHNQWALIVFSSFVIYSYLRFERLASLSTAPVFLYCYGVINTTYGFTMELYFYQLLHVALMMFILARVMFWLLPTPASQFSARQPKMVLKRSKSLNFLATTIITLSLVYFLSIEVSKAIFCLSVIISIAFRTSYLSVIKGVKSILPLQVSGCFVALVLHMLVAGESSNLLLSFIVLFGFSIVIFYFMHQTGAQFKDIPNFEIGLLAATLTPFTLYTHSVGFDVGPFVRRASNMGFIWILGSLLLIVVPWCLTWFHQKSHARSIRRVR